MLSIKSLTCANSAASYYMAISNYYTNDSAPLGWQGKGAKRLGLAGEIDKAQFLELLQGKLPDGTTLENKKGEHRPGFDMTFSAPKSVSILAATGAAPWLIHLHDKAVQMAISDLEKEFAETRIVNNGQIQFEKTDNLMVATFREFTSRANDPDLHTHAPVMNITFDKEGNARSLSSDIHAHHGVVEQLQKNIVYAGMRYRLYLSNLLKEAGCSLTMTGDGLFEIEGMPEAVLKNFSKRRDAIETLMQEKRWVGAAASSVATLLTREAKETIPLDTLKQRWEQECQSLNFSPHQLAKDMTTSAKSHGLFNGLKGALGRAFSSREKQDEPVHAKVGEAVFVAIESVSQKTSVFTQKALMAEAMKHVIGSGYVISPSEIEANIKEAVDQQLLYSGTCALSQGTVYTTPWSLTMEVETLMRVERNKGAVKPMGSKRQVMRSQQEYERTAQHPLTAHQKQAIMLFMTNTDRFVALQGYAGVGKTTLLKVINQLACEQGFTLRGLAVSSSASNELSQKAGIKTEVFSLVQHELMQSNRKNLAKTVFVADESSLLSSPQGHLLIKQVEKRNARLVLVGDEAQLPTVKNGRLFGLLQERGIATLTVSQIIRQKSPALKEAVTHCTQGEIYDSLHKLTSVREYDTYEERICAVAREWLISPRSMRDRTLIFAPTHQNRHDITLMLREELKKEGVLSGEPQVLSRLTARTLEDAELRFTNNYRTGDVVRFNLSSLRAKIKSGDYYTLGHITAEHKRSNSLPIINAKGQSRLFRLNELPDYKSHHAGLSRPIEVYEPKDIELMAGDTILWCRNHKMLDITNSTRATITEITDSHLSLHNIDSGDSLRLNITDPALRHLDYGYVFTNVKVQGKDKHYGIGFMESGNRPNTTLQNFYVQISRAIYEMRLVTDNKVKLVRSLEHNPNQKEAALDIVSPELLEKHLLRFQPNHKANYLSIATQQAQLFSNQKENELVIEQYRQAKENDDRVTSAQLATRILSDKGLAQIASRRLGYNYHEYRQDALRVETVKLLGTASEGQKQTLLNVQHYVRLTHRIRAEWEHFYQLPEDQQSTLIKDKIFSLTVKRNQYAYTIAQVYSQHERYLRHHSIGEINRLGLPQHRYFDEMIHAEKRALRLHEHAEQHLVREQVEQFFAKNTKNLYELAHQIKANPKLAHPPILAIAKLRGIAVNELWREVHFADRAYQDAVYRNQLSKEQQVRFDVIQTYRKASGEVGKAWSIISASMERNNEASKEAHKTMEAASTTRNALAKTLLEDPHYEPLMAYFKLSPEKIRCHADKNTKRQTVVTFLTTRSHFEKKMQAASDIVADLKGHYPFLKSLGYEHKRHGVYLNIAKRKTHFAELSPPERGDHLAVLQYRHSAKTTGAKWRAYFDAKKQGYPLSPDTFKHLLVATAERNAQAFKLHQEPHRYEAAFSMESVSLEKLATQARAHELHLRELREISEQAQCLLARFSDKSTALSHREANTWLLEQRRLNNYVRCSITNNPTYEAALKQYPLSLDTLSEKGKALVRRYGLKPDHSETKHAQKSYETSSQALSAVTVNSALMNSPREAYTAIFGEPKSHNSRELRYPGGLVVSLTGAKAGLWYDFGEGQGGNPISAIMREKQLDFKDALSHGAALAGVSANSLKTVRHAAQSTPKQVGIEHQNGIISAQSIWAGTKPLAGTLAEIYLERHRGIEKPATISLRFWPKGMQWKGTDPSGKLIEKTNKIPALVIAAYDHHGKITGVQRVYLDEKTADKNSFMASPKLSKGTIKGSAGVLQKGEKGSQLYIAEGPETAASVAKAAPEATVLVAFGVSNIANLGKIAANYQPSEIIIAADNDQKVQLKTQEATEKAASELAKSGFNVRVSYPGSISQLSKTDWNDVLKVKGIVEVRRQLGLEQEVRIAGSKASLAGVSQSLSDNNLPSKDTLKPSISPPETPSIAPESLERER